MTMFLVCSVAFSAEKFQDSKSTIIKDVLTEYVANKVEQMQHLIKFDDIQSKQLKELELKFLLDVQKAENCPFCNTRKKTEKLKLNREQDLQKILTREQFLKYDAIEKDRIKIGNLRSAKANY